jgi:hypothetical protein
LLECIRDFDQACGWHEQGAVSCAHWLSWRVGWDPGTARERVRVAGALGRLPAFDEALRSGRLSYAKVRALTRVATPEERSVHRRLLPGGRVKLELVLEPDEANLVLRAVDRAQEVRAGRR